MWSLDGTILNTFPTLVNAYKVSSELQVDTADIIQKLKTESLFNKEKGFLNAEQMKNFWQVENSYDITMKEPFPFVDKVLGTAEKNFLVTHRNRASTILLLKKWNLYDFFFEIICLPDDTHQKKPSTTSYHYLLEAYGINLVIGSRDIDIKPARELQLKTCSFQNRDIKADYYLDNYQDFPSLLLSYEFYVDFGTRNIRVTPTLLEDVFKSDENKLEHALQVALKDNDSSESILLTTGLSRSLHRTKFYPLDSALFALELGMDYTVILPILFHSLSFGQKMDREHPHFHFYKKCSTFFDKTLKEKTDWLTYCELTTSPTGVHISIHQRIEQLIRENRMSEGITQHIKKMNYYFEELEERFEKKN